MPLEIHAVEPGLWVGPCPIDPDDSRALVAQGVGAILSLQTDEDLRRLGLRWEVVWGGHVAAGLAVSRVPIRDLDRKDLTAHVEAALEALDELAQGGRGVYVHCTAGLNRSPTICIAALARRHGLSLDDAQARLLAAHPNAVPYIDTLTRWHKRLR